MNSKTVIGEHLTVSKAEWIPKCGYAGRMYEAEIKDPGIVDAKPNELFMLFSKVPPAMCIVEIETQFSTKVAKDRLCI